jgi:hypothetical protein
MSEADRFNYYAFDLVSNSLRDELPLSTFEWTNPLVPPDTWQATIDRDNLKAIRANLEPGATGIYVERGKSLLFGGILWATKASSKDPTVQLGGQGRLGYYGNGRRFLRDRAGMTSATGTPAIEITFTAIDVFNIVADLLAHAANYAANLGYTAVRFHGPGAGVANGTLSTNLKTTTYWAYELKNILDAIIELATQSPGFEISESCEWDSANNRPFHYLDLWYPRRGVSAANGPTFIVGKNVSMLGYTLDASKMANVVTATGSGTADAMKTSEASDSTVIGTYPRLEGINTYRDESVDANLAAHAAANLSLSKKPVETLELEVIEGSDSALTSWGTGDTGLVQATQGFITVNNTYRVLKKSVKIDDKGFPTIGATMGDEAASLGVA